MIGQLPKVLKVSGQVYPINSDYRAVLQIFVALNDDELSATNKVLTMLEILYQFNVPDNMEEACKQAKWFFDVGDTPHGNTEIKTMDYVQDEQLIFSGINAVVGHDIRMDEYMHWWTFYGLCQAISPESLISHVTNIRYKKAKNEKLAKHEQEFYKENKHLIDWITKKDDYEDMVAALRGGR